MKVKAWPFYLLVKTSAYKEFVFIPTHYSSDGVNNYLKAFWNKRKSLILFSKLLIFGSIVLEHFIIRLFYRKIHLASLAPRLAFMLPFGLLYFYWFFTLYAHNAPTFPLHQKMKMVHLTLQYLFSNKRNVVKFTLT